MQGTSGRKLRTDSLLVLDDAAQRIYPGGFRPAWANLNFTGNSNSLHVNYRNSRRIFQAARAVRGEAIISKDANDATARSKLSASEGDEGDRPVPERYQW